MIIPCNLEHNPVHRVVVEHVCKGSYNCKQYALILGSKDWSEYCLNSVSSALQYGIYLIRLGLNVFAVDWAPINPPLVGLA